jgi:uncharacterized protein YceH (UPF0502 family)
MEAEKAIPQLNAEEIRVLGVLIEKSKTTPEYYPLTLNALVTACNQKTSRNPVVNYDDDIVISTLDSLKKKQLINTVIGGGSRTMKYRHALSVHFSLDAADLTVLCLLFLRGPLTAGEINSNAGRLYEFDDLDEVQQTLNSLSSQQLPFVKLLPKKPGQKEGRFVHLFADVENLYIHEESQITPDSQNSSILENRISELEIEVSDLKEKVERLMKELGIED